VAQVVFHQLLNLSVSKLQIDFPTVGMTEIAEHGGILSVAQHFQLLLGVIQLVPSLGEWL
jgi:hypothetical protein